jgi:hypothetical protein
MNIKIKYFFFVSIMGKHRKKINNNTSHSQLLEERLREKQKFERLQEDWTNWNLTTSIPKIVKSKNIVKRKNDFASNAEITFEIRIVDDDNIIFYNKDDIFNLNNTHNPQLPLITGVKYVFTLDNPTAIFSIKKSLYSNQNKNNENLQDKGNIFNNPLQGGLNESLIIIKANSTYDTFFPKYEVIKYGNEISELDSNSFKKKTITNFIIIHQINLLYPLQDIYSEDATFCSINTGKKTTGVGDNYYNEVLFCSEKNDEPYFFNGGINHKLTITETTESNNYKVSNNEIFILNNKIEYDEDRISKMIMQTTAVEAIKGMHLKLPDAHISSILNTSNSGSVIPSFLRVLYKNGYIIIKTNNWVNFLNYYPLSNGSPVSKSLAFKIEYPRTKDDTCSQVIKYPFTNSQPYRNKYGILLSPEYPRPMQNFSYILMGRITKKLTHWFWFTGKPSEILLVEPTIPYIGAKLHYIDKNGAEHSSAYSDPSKYPNRFKKQVKKNILITPDKNIFSYKWDDSWIGTNDFITFEISKTIPTTNNYNWETPSFQYRMIIGTFPEYDQSIFDLDDYGGRLNPLDNTYRIHSPTIFLEKNADGTYKYADCIIGYTIDGYPVLGPGSKNYPTQTFDNETIATSSYKLKTKAERNAETEFYGGHQQYAYGLYVSDWLYTEGHGNLDVFNGGYAFIDGFERVLFMTPTFPFFPPFLNNSVTDLQTS